MTDQYKPNMNDDDSTQCYSLYLVL